MTDVRALTMQEARLALTNGTVSAEDIIASTKQAREKLNPTLKAFSWLAPDQKAIFHTGHPLAGFSMALKANICARDMRTDCGSRLMANHFPAYDSTVVARLRKAGAHFPGTTAMDEFGMGSSCEYSAWGPVSNPWDTEHIAGGSSGGSAAAVAAGMAWYALGTDTGGSVRYPAHCCGLVGLKPTYGRISRFGLVAFASSLDTMGIIARDTADAALVFNTLAGHDPLDATSLTCAVEPLSAELSSITGMTVGVPWGLMETELQPGVLDDFKLSLQQLEDRGVRIVSVNLPSVREFVAAYSILASAEAASNLARFDGTAYGSRISGNNYQEMVRNTRTRGFGIEVKRRILMGTHVLSEGYRNQFYERAVAWRNQLKNEFKEIFTTVQAVATPTAAGGAFLKGSRVDDPLAMYHTDVFTLAANLAGLPALSIPTATDSDGMPLSIQFMGEALSEDTLLKLGTSLEKYRQFRSTKEAPWHRPLA